MHALVSEQVQALGLLKSSMTGLFRYNRCNRYAIAYTGPQLCCQGAAACLWLQNAKFAPGEGKAQGKKLEK